MPAEKIRIDLCHDHFQRLIHGNVCEHCPSKIENEILCRNMAAEMKAESDAGSRAVVMELASIRRSQAELSNVLDRLETRVHGNGTDGILHRLLIVETKLNQSAKALSVNIAIAGVLISTILSALGLVLN